MYQEIVGREGNAVLNNKKRTGVIIIHEKNPSSVVQNLRRDASGNRRPETHTDSLSPSFSPDSLSVSAATPHTHTQQSNSQVLSVKSMKGKERRRGKELHSFLCILCNIRASAVNLVRSVKKINPPLTHETESTDSLSKPFYDPPPSHPSSSFLLVFCYSFWDLFSIPSPLTLIPHSQRHGRQPVSMDP